MFTKYIDGYLVGKFISEQKVILNRKVRHKDNSINLSQKIETVKNIK